MTVNLPHGVTVSAASFTGTFSTTFCFPVIFTFETYASASSLHIFSAVAKDKDKQSFKLRAGMDKKIVIYVQQTSNKELAIER